MEIKITAIFASILISLSFVSLFPVNAESTVLNSDIYATGAIWETIEPNTPEQASAYSATTASTLPTSFDITTNAETAKFFPQILSQGSIGSCTAWATTYYQFTYEVNKLRNRNVKDTSGNNIDENIYSPTWTYNYLNGGENQGTSIYDAYRVLRRQGAMNLADLPYNSASYSYAWPTDLAKMTEALEYRTYEATCFVTDSTEINEAKELLAAGHPLVVYTNVNGWRKEETSNGETIIVRGSDYNGSTGGHAMTIVGYDDTIQVTVGSKTLTGALKLANSWGDDWENNGYIWVAYDALSPTSTNITSGNGNRTPIFSGVQDGINQLAYITARYCKVNFAGYVQYASDAPYNVTLYAQNGSTITETENTLKWGNYVTTEASDSSKLSYLVFDYFTLSDNGVYSGDSYNMSNCLSSSWTVKMNHPNAYSSSRMLTRVIDNFGNTIAPVSTGVTSLSSGSATKTIPVNLNKGRVTAYDNNPITSEDSQMVLEFIVENIDFSNVQRYLADYNNDGAISLTDVTAMNSAISAQNGETYVITDYIDEWGCSLADVIEEEYNMPIEQYVAENYAELSAINAVPSELELY